MGKLFGTDGVRGIVSSELDSYLALKIGASTARVLSTGKEEKLTFLVGSDTRLSKDALKNGLIAGVLSENANIIDLGVIPTPAVSYLIQKYQAAGGFVISASHNPSEYNGIKVFNNEGMKLSDSIEEKIENVILNNFEITKGVNKLGKYEYRSSAIDDYVDFLKKTVTSDLSNLKIGIDTANGAAYKTAAKLFTSLNIDFQIINNSPDGLNINQNAGSTHIEGLQKLVVENNLDCGVAFDGDADRALFVDNEGNIVDGDKIMAICSKQLQEKNLLKNNTLVGTVMSNLGLIKYCKKEGINFVATKVGDRYVLENMLANDYILGGEQSGHIIFKDLANTGDGELTAIQILNVMAEKKKSLKELGSIMDTYPQVLKNVSVSKEGKETYAENEKIKAIIKEKENILADNGRILVRKSGTENLIRVMIEGKDIELINRMADEIVNVINQELK